jgi:hypothetical protein
MKECEYWGYVSCQYSGYNICCSNKCYTDYTAEYYCGPTNRYIDDFTFSFVKICLGLNVILCVFFLALTINYFISYRK